MILQTPFLSRLQSVAVKVPRRVLPGGRPALCYSSTVMSSPAAKKQRTHPQYELLYHPGTPGRGEFVRLAFEAGGVSYKDVANEQKGGYAQVQAAIDPEKTCGEDDNLPGFAPPLLRIPGAGKDGKCLIVGQTPVILDHIGPQLGLAPEDEQSRLQVSQLAHTALDLNNEVHDTHHPIANQLYYEEQKDEALQKAKNVRETRFPRFFGYFERVLKGNEAGKHKYLVGDKLSYADTTVWQVVDGSYFAFPNEMQALKKSYPALLDTFYNNLKTEKGIKEYLASERRLPYSEGIFRYYPELDRQDEKETSG